MSNSRRHDIKLKSFPSLLQTHTKANNFAPRYASLKWPDIARHTKYIHFTLRAYERAAAPSYIRREITFHVACSFFQSHACLIYLGNNTAVGFIPHAARHHLYESWRECKAIWQMKKRRPRWIACMEIQVIMWAGEFIVSAERLWMDGRRSCLQAGWQSWLRTRSLALHWRHSRFCATKWAQTMHLLWLIKHRERRAPALHRYRRAGKAPQRPTRVK